MFGNNIKHSLITWTIILIAVNFTIFLVLHYAYIGPPEKFWETMWFTWRVMTGTTIILAVASELLFRFGRRNKD
jgi:hypothetical protein